MNFTVNEIEYLNSQPLGRLATVGPGGRPHVAPVGVFYDLDTQTIVIGGHAGTNMAASKKLRDAERHPPRRILTRGIDTDPFDLSARDVG
jgi:pyridoxamine 5'-phosphate oxidase family protein